MFLKWKNILGEHLGKSGKQKLITRRQYDRSILKSNEETDFWAKYRPQIRRAWVRTMALTHKN